MVSEFRITATSSSRTQSAFVREASNLSKIFRRMLADSMYFHTFLSACNLVGSKFVVENDGRVSVSGRTW